MSEKSDNLIQSIDSELQHYGVLGMKWGIRRPVGSNGLIRKTAKNAKKIDTPKSEDSKAVSGLRKKATKTKNIKNMTDDEIRLTTDRVNLENNMKRLAKTTDNKKIYKLKDRLSNEEIRAVNQRMQLEANLKESIRNANADSIKLGNSLANIAAKTTVSVVKTKASDNDLDVNTVISALKKEAIKESKSVARESVNNSGASVFTKTLVNESLGKKKKKG